MPVSDVVKSWCRERNADSRAWLFFFVLLMVTVCGIYSWSTLGVGAASLALMAWVFFAPKPLHAHHLSREEDVPDSLLASLADAPAVPDWVKTQIADTLAEDGRITFRAIYDIESSFLRGQDIARRNKGDGFQKMVGFRNKPDEKEK